MPLTLLPHATQKPPVGPLTVDIGNPLSGGLVFASPLTEYGSNVVNDYSPGYAGTGALKATPPWQSGSLGAQLGFDGTTQYVDFGTAPAARTAAKLSIVAWIVHRGTVSARAMVGWFQSSATTYEFRLTDTHKLELLKEASASLGVSTGTVPSNTLTQVGVTYDGTNGLFYVDGAQGSSFTSTNTFSYAASDNIRIASQSGASGSEFFNGSIAAVYIWNRVLSAGEMASITAEPFQLFRTRPIQRWFVVGGQTAMPISDISAGSWTSSLGGSLYVPLDEATADDTDYDQSSASASPDVMEVRLTSLSTPVAGQITVKYRFRTG